MNGKLLCCECKQPLDKGGKYCASCLYKRIKQHRKNYVNKKHLNNICTMCNQPLDRKGWVCNKCKQIVSDKQKIKIKYRRDNHLCVKCKTPVLDNGATCVECRKKIALYTKYHRAKIKKKNEDLYCNTKDFRLSMLKSIK